MCWHLFLSTMREEKNLLVQNDSIIQSVHLVLKGKQSAPTVQPIILALHGNRCIATALAFRGNRSTPNLRNRSSVSVLSLRRREATEYIGCGSFALRAGLELPAPSRHCENDVRRLRESRDSFSRYKETVRRKRASTSVRVRINLLRRVRRRLKVRTTRARRRSFTRPIPK